VRADRCQRAQVFKVPGAPCIWRSVAVRCYIRGGGNGKRAYPPSYIYASLMRPNKAETRVWCWILTDIYWMPHRAPYRA